MSNAFISWCVAKLTEQDLCINIGSLSPIATTEMELHIGFWSAYLLCLCAFVVGFITLIFGKKKYVVRPPKGSVIPNAFRIMWIGIRSGNLDNAKPQHAEETTGRRISRPWDSVFVEEVRRALVACKAFLFYPIYWVV